MVNGDKLLSMKGLDYYNKNVVSPNYETVKTLASAVSLLQSIIDAQNMELGDISTLNTSKKDTVVNAINELKFNIDALGEPFRVKQWAGSNLNVEIPYCTEDITNTNIAKMVFKINGEEANDFQIIGMLSYEVKDKNSQRLNCWPVCQFTGQNQTELSVRWMCGGSTRKTAASINAWVLLKHR